MSRKDYRRRPDYTPVIWHPGMGKCPLPPHKRRYPSRKTAAKAQDAHGGSYYRCKNPGCGGYHLTHYPPNVQRAINLLIESIRHDREQERRKDYARRGIPLPG